MTQYYYIIDDVLIMYLTLLFSISESRLCCFRSVNVLFIQYENQFNEIYTSSNEFNLLVTATGTLVLVWEITCMISLRYLFGPLISYECCSDKPFSWYKALILP